MLRLIRRRPAVATAPTIDNGRSAEPAVQNQVFRNQSKSAALWDETNRDLAVANIVHEREEIRAAHWQILIAAVLAIILLVGGSFYTYRNMQHDRLLAQERGSAVGTSYAPNSAVPSH